MGDENQPSKKRAAGRELSRDNPGLDDEEDVPEQEMGTFKKASDEVLAGRRIVKVRRQPTSTEPSAPSSNPFAGIRLVPPAVSAATPANATSEAQVAEDKTAVEDTDKKGGADSEAEVTSQESEEKTSKASVESNKDQVTLTPEAVEVNKLDQGDQDDADNAVKNLVDTVPTVDKEADGSAERTSEANPTDEKQAEVVEAESIDKKDDENPNASINRDTPLSSFQQLSNNQNAFTGLSGTGFTSSTFSFGSIKDSSASQSSLPTFSFGASNNGSTSLFGTAAATLGSPSEGATFPPMQEVPRETGEENEETVFSADSALFEFIDGGWKERGKGEVKLNVLKGDSRRSRLVMRAKGNLRLILNASLYSDMKLTKMDKKGISFACVNTATEGKDGLSTFALKFKEVFLVEEFCSAVSSVSENKSKGAAALKTPENSP